MVEAIGLGINYRRRGEALLVVAPQPQHLDDPLVFYHLTDESMLNVDSSRVGTDKIANEFSNGGGFWKGSSTRTSCSCWLPFASRPGCSHTYAHIYQQTPRKNESHPGKWRQSHPVWRQTLPYECRAGQGAQPLAQLWRDDQSSPRKLSSGKSLFFSDFLRITPSVTAKGSLVRLVSKFDSSKLNRSAIPVEGHVF